MVKTLAWVLVLIQGRTVEAGQTVRVAREVRRYPVENHAEAAFVGGLDEVAELVRWPVADRGGEQANGLVAPGAVKGMLGQGQELDVRKAQVGHVVDEFAGGLLVGQHAAVLIETATPGTEVDLVDTDRGLAPVALHPLLHPGIVVPAVAANVAHHGGVLGRVLGAEADGIGLEGKNGAVASFDPVLVESAFTDARHVALPDSGLAHGAHGRGLRFPGVEVAHHGDTPGGGRPDREVNTVAVAVCAEDLPQALMGPLVEQVAVLLANPLGARVGRLPFGRPVLHVFACFSSALIDGDGCSPVPMSP